jgi:YD repeat-containing protein
MTTPCDCPSCVNGCPQEWTLPFNTSNHLCTLCASLVATYHLSLTGPCAWGVSFGGPTCITPFETNYTTWNLMFSGACRDISAELHLGGLINFDPPIWNASGIVDCRQSPITLTINRLVNSDCMWPSEVVITPTMPATSSWASYSCMPAMNQGCAFGSNLSCVCMPSLGKATAAALTAGGLCQTCGCGGGCGSNSGCGCSGSCGTDETSMMTLSSCCSSCLVPCECSAVSEGEFCDATAVSATVAGAIVPGILAGLPSLLAPTIPGMSTGAVKLNLSNGNVVMAVAHPSGGPFDPRPTFIYNSLTPASSSYGTGWSELHRLVLSQPGGADSNVSVTDGTGATAQYGYMSGSGWFCAAGTCNSLEASGVFIETQPDGFQRIFDSTGPVSKFQDTSGNVWTVTYDGSERTQAIINPFGQRTTFAYDGSGNIKRVQDRSGRITTLTVNGSGDLVRVVSPELCQTSLIYNGSHQLTSVIDPELRRTTISYDATLGWAMRFEIPGGGITTINYLDWGTTTVVNPRGNTTTVLYNFARNITGVIDPLGNARAWNWSNDLPTSYTDANGNTTALNWVELSNSTLQLESVVQPNGAVYSIAYDGDYRVSSVSAPLVGSTTLRWDSNNNRKAFINTLGQRVSFAWTGNGQLASSISPLGQRNTLLYNSTGEATGQMNPLGNRTTLIYDGYGNVEAVMNPLGARTTYVRNLVNQVVAIIDPLNRRTSYTYQSGCGQVVAAINPLGNRNTSIYDNAGNLTATIDPLGNRNSVAYDLNGNPRRKQNPLQRSFTYVYDVRDQLVARINPLLNRTTWAYDRVGNNVNFTNALVETTTKVFDENNKRVAVVDALGNRATTILDLLSRAVSIIDPLSSRTTWQYDILSQIIVAIDPLGHRQTQVYDANGRRTGAVNAIGKR